MIATIGQIVTILDLTTDAEIDKARMLLPIVQSDVIDYTNNLFTENDRYVSGDGIAFVSSGRQITDEDEGFIDASFYAGMDIYVDGSLNNDGIYEVANVAAGTLTLASDFNLIDEDAGEGVIIWKVKFPQALTLIAAQMIKALMSGDRLAGIKAKSLGDYSETFEIGGNSYPVGIEKALNKYRRIAWE
ncbi:MAG: hypothetical protein JRJ62_04760 [Deltaproteobacteria bacterium]|nr:hypothetical protein [Deltaproteobacteria bacterium]